MQEVSDRLGFHLVLSTNEASSTCFSLVLSPSWSFFWFNEAQLLQAQGQHHTNLSKACKLAPVL